MAAELLAQGGVDLGREGLVLTRREAGEEREGDRRCGNQLVDRGLFDLDAPIERYLPDYLRHDARSASITVRHLLSHSAGLPNWRNADYPLRTWFRPGARFSSPGLAMMRCL